MDEAERRRILEALANLAAFVAAGGEVEVMARGPRSRRGPDRAAYRLVVLRISRPAAYDDFRWERTKRAVRRLSHRY